MDTKLDILNKIIKHNTEITGIRVDGVLYNVDYVNTELQDIEDIENFDDTLVYAYQLDEDNMYLEYFFDVEDIKKAKTVVLYKLQEI